MRGRNAVFGSRRAGRTWTVRSSTGPGFNGVVDGLRKELEYVALVDLARAVDDYRQGEALMRRREYNHAIQEYQQAIETFYNWGQRRGRRDSPGVFEPGRRTHFQY